MPNSSPNVPYSNGPASEQIANIRQTLLMMASLANRNLALAMRALVERDEKLAASVEAEDSQLDELEVTIDELVINHMATHAPVATDCRFMLVASKISSNLERIADQATAIARRSRRIEQGAAAQAADRYSAHGADRRGHAARQHHGADRPQARARPGNHQARQGSRRRSTSSSRAN